MSGRRRPQLTPPTHLSWAQAARLGRPWQPAPEPWRRGDKGSRYKGPAMASRPPPCKVDPSAGSRGPMSRQGCSRLEEYRRLAEVPSRQLRRRSPRPPTARKDRSTRRLGAAGRVGSSCSWSLSSQWPPRGSLRAPPGTGKGTLQTLPPFYAKRARAPRGRGRAPKEPMVMEEALWAANLARPLLLPGRPPPANRSLRLTAAQMTQGRHPGGAALLRPRRARRRLWPG